MKGGCDVSGEDCRCVCVVPVDTLYQAAGESPRGYAPGAARHVLTTIHAHAEGISIHPPVLRESRRHSRATGIELAPGTKGNRERREEESGKCTVEGCVG